MRSDLRLRRRQPYWVFKRKISPFWYAKVATSTGYVYRSTGEKLKYKAIERVETWLHGDLVKEEEAAAGMGVFPDLAPKILTDYFAWRDSIGRPYSPKLVKEWSSRVRVLGDAFDCTLSNLTSGLIEDYFLGAYQAGRSHRSLQEDKKLLGIVCAEMLRHGYLKENPAPAARLPGRTTSTERGILESDAVGALFGPLSTAWGSTFWQAGAHLSLCTGLRRGEVAALTWEDIRPDGWAIIKHSVDTLGNVREGGKTGRSRWAFISADLRAVLEAAVPWRSGYIITPSGGAEPGKPASIAQAFERALTTSGIRSDSQGHPITFHSLRHTYNTRLIGQGAAVADVQRLLGHNSDAMTARYLHQSPETLSRLRKAAESAGWKVV